MSRQSNVLVLAVVASLAVGAAVPGLYGWLRGGGAPKASKGLSGAQNDTIPITPEQIEAEKIETAAVGPGVLRRRLTVPAAINPDPNKLARVAAKVAGTVLELKKRLGDDVALNEVVAVLDSREVADAKSEYLAAVVNYDLQNLLYQREKGLFDKKITAEQLFLKAKTTFAEAKLRLDLARQKLASLDMSEQEIAALPTQPISALRRKDIRAPIAGRVIERLVNLGQPVGGEGQPKELYVLSDLSSVEADLSVPAGDLGLLREGQRVALQNAEGRGFEGKIIYVNAIITRETRSGQVIASFANPDLELRPGSLLEAEVALKETPVKVLAPRAATIIVDGRPSVFVRSTNGFVKRNVEIGRGDDEAVEIVSGLAPGEVVAVTNVFLLKAELGKHNIPEE